MEIDCGCGCESCTNRYCVNKIDIFSTLSVGQMEQVTNMIIHKDFKKGDIIFSEGDTADKLYVLNSGSLKVFTINSDGKEQILYILKEGDFLGDLNLLKKSIFSYNAEALGDMNICTLRKDDFNTVIAENPEITIKILEHTYDRIMGLESLVKTVSIKDADIKLANLLREFSKSFGVETKNGIEIALPLSREDMANYLGITRETISRKLSNLQSEGIIELIGNKKLIVKDLEALEKIY